MPELKQPDLFGDDPQEALFPEDAPAPVYRADPDRVRAKLLRILAEARAAETLPWDSESARFYQTVFPQMTRWLPEEEAAQLRFEFETEMERLAQAA